MKVLHIITWLAPGGIETWLLHTLDEIRGESSITMDVCCKGVRLGGLANVARSRGAQIHHCPLSAVNVPVFLMRLRKLVSSGGYDLVHNHLELYAGLPVLACTGLNVPVISSFHNTRFAPQTWTRLPLIRQVRVGLGAWSVKYALRHSAHLTGCSAAVCSSLDSYTTMQRRCEVLYYGLPKSAFAGAKRDSIRRATRAANGWNHNDPIILHVGRFHAQKNHKGLLNIFEHVRTRIPAAKLVLIGDGPLKSAIRQEVRRRKLEQHVDFLGIRRDVFELMCAADVFLFPSLFEGFGLVAAEAAAARLPVVGSEVPGISEAVENGTTGFLHVPNDTRGMAASVTRLCTDTRLASRIGLQGGQWARRHFSMKIQTQKLLQIYSNCISTAE